MRPHSLVRSVVCVLAAAVVTMSMAQPARAAGPETVMVTLHAKPGSEEALARVLDAHWRTARRLNLVREDTHVTLRGSEDGDKTYFVEVFTWLDADIPDHAPDAIQSIWKEMNSLVESRRGEPGLRFVEVSVVVPPDGQTPARK